MIIAFNKQLLLASCILLYSLQAMATENIVMVGEYIADGGGNFEIVKIPKEEAIAVSYGHGHLMQIANVESNLKGDCYMFGSWDIIIPFDLTQDSVVECIGGKATVVSEGVEFKLRDGGKTLVSKVEINRYGEATKNGKTYRRAGGERTYFLYVSKQHGLIGIEFEPSKAGAIFRRK